VKAERDPLQPQAPGGTGRGAMLALLAHGLLILAITFAVRWRSSEPAGVEAELWAAVPQTAAPRMPTPAPEPAPKPEAEIAEEVQKKPPPKPEPPPPPPAPAPPPKPVAAKPPPPAPAPPPKPDRAEQQRLDKLREDNLRRMMAEAGGTGEPSSTGSAARDAGPSAGYAGRIKARIRPNIVLLDSIAGNPVAEVEVRVAPDGHIIGRRLLKSSGVPEWDESVLRAVDRTEVLPRDTDGRVPPTIIITFRPQD
jgi:colicin import membrane protein